MACRWYSVCPLRRWETEGRLSRSWAQDFCETTDNWATVEGTNWRTEGYLTQTHASQWTD